MRLRRRLTLRFSVSFLMGLIAIVSVGLWALSLWERSLPLWVHRTLATGVRVNARRDVSDSLRVPTDSELLRRAVRVEILQIPFTDRLYGTETGDGTPNSAGNSYVVVIDQRTNAIVSKLAVPGDVRALAVDPVRETIYAFLTDYEANGLQGPHSIVALDAEYRQDQSHYSNGRPSTRTSGRCRKRAAFTRRVRGIRQRRMTSTNKLRAGWS